MTVPRMRSGSLLALGGADEPLVNVAGDLASGIWIAGPAAGQADVGEFPRGVEGFPGVRGWPARPAWAAARS